MADMALLSVSSRVTVALSGEKAWQDTAHGEVLRVLEHTVPLAAWAGWLNMRRGWWFPDRKKTTDSAAVRPKEK